MVNKPFQIYNTCVYHFIGLPKTFNKKNPIIMLDIHWIIINVELVKPLVLCAKLLHYWCSWNQILINAKNEVLINNKRD